LPTRNWTPPGLRSHPASRASSAASGSLTTSGRGSGAFSARQGTAISASSLAKRLVTVTTGVGATLTASRLRASRLRGPDETLAPDDAGTLLRPSGGDPIGALSSPVPVGPDRGDEFVPDVARGPTDDDSWLGERMGDGEGCGDQVSSVAGCRNGLEVFVRFSDEVQSRAATLPRPLKRGRALRLLRRSPVLTAPGQRIAPLPSRCHCAARVRRPVKPSLVCDRAPRGTADTRTADDHSRFAVSKGADARRQAQRLQGAAASVAGFALVLRRLRFRLGWHRDEPG